MEARFNERIRELQACPEQMYDYIAECIPYISEYTQKSEATTDSLFASRRGGVKRKDIFNKYLQNVEGTAIETTPAPRHYFHRCPCGSDSYTEDPSTSDVICTECGTAKQMLGEEMGFKEEQEMEKNVNYSYKRDNHLNEWIAQFQAKESTTVPDEVINLIRAEFKKRRIKDISEITQSKVKEVLKKLRLNKYYEHSPYIAMILNGIKPPTMTQSLEDRLRLMFNQVQAPFERHCPPDRKNFLSYSYVLYKFCELLSEDDYLQCFPLLKSKEKLYKQDQIWKKICGDLKWEYIPTI